MNTYMYFIHEYFANRMIRIRIIESALYLNIINVYGYRR